MTSMRKNGIRTTILAALVVLLLVPAAAAKTDEDVVQIYDKKDGWRDQKGVTITKDTIEGVAWKNKARRTESKPVGEVRGIAYGDAPAEWTKGLSDYASGRYDEAIESFKGAVNAFEADRCREWVKEYAAFQIGLCKAAQARADRKRLDVALGELRKFTTDYPKSRLLPDALLAHANLLVLAGKARDARRQFETVERLAKSNKLFVKYEFRALLGKAQTLAMEQDWTLALTEFQSIGQRAEIELRVAKLALAKEELGEIRLLAAGRLGDAHIAKAEASRSARDFAAAKSYFQSLKRKDLGDPARVKAMSGVGEAICLLSEDKARDALIRLAEVKIQYFSQRNEVAKALYYMAEAAKKLNRKRLAAAYRKELKEHYPDSEWARRAD